MIPAPQPPQAVPQLLLTPDDAAQALAISERTLWSMTKAGKIPAVHIGRAVRYSVEDLQAWVRQNRTTGLKLMGQDDAT